MSSLVEYLADYVAVLKNSDLKSFIRYANLKKRTQLDFIEGGRQSGEWEQKIVDSEQITSLKQFVVGERYLFVDSLSNSEVTSRFTRFIIDINGHPKFHGLIDRFYLKGERCFEKEGEIEEFSLVQYGVVPVWPFGYCTDRYVIRKKYNIGHK